MNMTSEKDIAWVNTLKGGCILLVVLYHVVLPGYADIAPLLTLPGSYRQNSGWHLITTFPRCVCRRSSLFRACWRPMPF